MDIDTIIKDLDAIVHCRDQGGLLASMSSASTLLELRRYQQPENDPRKTLAKDIKTAIARLPKDLRTEANGLLIDMPGEYIIGRLRHLGKAGYSTPAKRWHREAVLGRVAVELMKLYVSQPSYSILDTKIRVDEEVQGNTLVTAGRLFRYIGFIWTVESHVSDLRCFVFSHHTERGLKFVDVQPGAEGFPCDSAARLAAGDRRNEHRYILSLSDNLPSGVPVQLRANFTYDKASKADSKLDYFPSIPTRRLSFSVTTWDKETCACVELDETGKQARKTFIAKTIDTTYEYDGIRSVEHKNEFSVRMPRVGRHYQLQWPKSPF